MTPHRKPLKIEIIYPSLNSFCFCLTLLIFYLNLINLLTVYQFGSVNIVLLPRIYNKENCSVTDSQIKFTFRKS